MESLVEPERLRRFQSAITQQYAEPILQEKVIMNRPLDDAALDTLFRSARSFSYWLDKPVTDEQIHTIYELMKWGPTAANSSPARIIFVKSFDAKERLRPCMSEGNVRKAMSAPAVALIAMDMEFYELLPKLYPHTDARSWYVGKPEAIRNTAFRNSTLQGAYLMMAARSLGLDCGPMSGFDAGKLEDAFFPGGRWKANFVCALGYGDESSLHLRGPRLSFEEACRIE